MASEIGLPIEFNTFQFIQHRQVLNQPEAHGEIGAPAVGLVKDRASPGRHAARAVRASLSKPTAGADSPPWT